MNHPVVFRYIRVRPGTIEEEIAARFAANPMLSLTLYLDLGTHDIPILISRVRNIIPILEQKNYTHRYFEFPDGHSWENRRAHIDNAPEMFFPSDERRPGVRLSSCRLPAHSQLPNPVRTAHANRF